MTYINIDIFLVCFISTLLVVLSSRRDVSSLFQGSRGDPGVPGRNGSRGPKGSEGEAVSLIILQELCCGVPSASLVLE